ncbi:hypothetical protein MSG28_001722 [Choristoneura fumiferana]|uniref:Uncharacterized protein n=1 Tax=Choristoneura fumiferana TaxID=7141 RepID=A0ACC0KVR0_CHOFU|nr:hypothetical protein MSG28_001722 [Choristoneura fumiferana]
MDGLIIGAALNLFHSDVDWKYNSDPQQYACLGAVNRKCYWPRGKMLGGTGSFNNMVYFRGNPADYNRWSALGNTGWSYEEVLPYFKKSEKILDPHIPEEEKIKYHYKYGPLPVSKHRGHNHLSDELLEAFRYIGIPTYEDLSGKHTVGALKTLALVLHVGTAKMGPLEDKTSVVSPELKVHGIRNLRIIDASIMPIITGGNINTPTIMIAEKGSDMIKQDWSSQWKK